MKAVTVTAILALLLSIPLAIRKYRARLQPVRSGAKPSITNEERLYDIDDFLS